MAGTFRLSASSRQSRHRHVCRFPARLCARSTTCALVQSCACGAGPAGLTPGQASPAGAAPDPVPPAGAVPGAGTRRREAGAAARPHPGPAQPSMLTTRCDAVQNLPTTLLQTISTDSGRSRRSGLGVTPSSPCRRASGRSGPWGGTWMKGEKENRVHDIICQQTPPPVRASLPCRVQEARAAPPPTRTHLCSLEPHVRHGSCLPQASDRGQEFSARGWHGVGRGVCSRPRHWPMSVGGRSHPARPAAETMQGMLGHGAPHRSQREAPLAPNLPAIQHPNPGQCALEAAVSTECESARGNPQSNETLARQRVRIPGLPHRAAYITTIAFGCSRTPRTLSSARLEFKASATPTGLQPVPTCPADVCVQFYCRITNVGWIRMALGRGS